ncbi:class B sortase [Eubacteriales bacterium OttesenSCG-928-M02]|nr:class B sortase [Eubacteriales bacterium OttesenSCG-928-M02]
MDMGKRRDRRNDNKKNKPQEERRVEVAKEAAGLVVDETQAAAIKEEMPPQRRGGEGDGGASGKKQKQSLKKSMLYNILIVICIGVFLFSGYQLYNILFERGQAKNEYESIVNDYAPVDPGVSPADRQIDFDALLAINSDVVGWIYNPGTVIDYPVVHPKGKEDVHYYLTHTFENKKNSAGAIYVDATSQPDFTSRNTTIHGHHMNNGSMFASLEKYKNREYLDEHPVLFLYTPNGNYEIHVFSTYVAHADDPYTQVAFANDDAFVSFVNGLIKRSMYDMEVDVAPTDNIVTLSTCTYNYDDARLVVHGVLRPLTPPTAETPVPTATPTP